MITATAAVFGHPTDAASEPEPSAAAARRAVADSPRYCPSALRAVKFYRFRVSLWERKLGVPRQTDRPPTRGCPRYIAHVLQRKAYKLRKVHKRWVYTRTLKDDGDWHLAVRRVQRPYPGTDNWLMSCSASEGGWGRWVPNSQGSGVGGWLQFMPGTFTGMYYRARADVTSRGYIVPRSSASWYSPLGQALAGAWAYENKQTHHWYGSGC